jgi:hypothetical protein
MKNTVFWDVAPYRSCVDRRFGGTYGLHSQSTKIRERGTSVSRWQQSAGGRLDLSIKNVSTFHTLCTKKEVNCLSHISQDLPRQQLYRHWKMQFHKYPFVVCEITIAISSLKLLTSLTCLRFLAYGFPIADLFGTNFPWIPHAILLCILQKMPVRDFGVLFAYSAFAETRQSKQSKSRVVKADGKEWTKRAVSWVYSLQSDAR